MRRLSVGNLCLYQALRYQSFASLTVPYMGPSDSSVQLLPKTNKPALAFTRQQCLYRFRIPVVVKFSENKLRAFSNLPRDIAEPLSECSQKQAHVVYLTSGDGLQSHPPRQSRAMLRIRK